MTRAGILTLLKLSRQGKMVAYIKVVAIEAVSGQILYRVGQKDGSSSV